MGRLAESGFRPEPTPRAYRGERVTGQAPCYAVRIHSPVRSVPAHRSCRARVGIQPGLIVPAQRSCSPVCLFGPGYPAPALCTVSPVRQHNSVRPVPAPRTCRATGRCDAWHSNEITFYLSNALPVAWFICELERSSRLSVPGQHNPNI